MCCAEVGGVQVCGRVHVCAHAMHARMCLCVCARLQEACVVGPREQQERHAVGGEGLGVAVEVGCPEGDGEVHEGVVLLALERRAHLLVEERHADLRNCVTVPYLGKSGNGCYRHADLRNCVTVPYLGNGPLVR